MIRWYLAVTGLVLGTTGDLKAEANAPKKNTQQQANAGGILIDSSQSVAAFRRQLLSEAVLPNNRPFEFGTTSEIKPIVFLEKSEPTKSKTKTASKPSQRTPRSHRSLGLYPYQPGYCPCCDSTNPLRMKAFRAMRRD